MNGHLGDRAAAYVDGALGPEEAQRAEAHLAGCEACRAKVAEQQRVRDLLRGSSTGGATSGPRPDLLAALASMPVAGPPPPSRVAVAAGPSRREVIRWGTVSGVAVGATVLATVWGVGGQVAVAGPSAVRPDRLMAQHTATAGELPFWGSSATSASGSSSGPAVSLLRRAAQASSTTSYRGVELVMTSQGSAPHTEVADVSHFADRGTSTLVVGGGTTPGTAVFFPEGATATSAALDAVGLLDHSYVLIPEGRDQVAGRDADRVAVYTPTGGWLRGSGSTGRRGFPWRVRCATAPVRRPRCRSSRP